MTIRQLVGCGLALLGGAGPVLGLNFTRVVGKGDPVPGSASGEAFREVLLPQLDGEWVAALGYSFTEDGLFAFRDGLGWRVMEATSPLAGVPAGATLSTSNISYDVDDSGTVVFATNWLIEGQPETEGTGVWQWSPSDGLAVPIVLNGDVVAGSDLPFLGATGVMVRDGIAVFVAGEGAVPDVQRALYVWTAAGGCRRVVGPGFDLLSQPTFSGDGGRVVFNGRQGLTWGVWSMLIDGTGVELVLDLSSDFPIGPAGGDWLLLTQIGSPNGYGTTGSPPTVAARSTTSFESQGIFRLWGGGQTELLYDGSGPDPISGLPHAGIDSALSTSGSEGAVAFVLRPTQIGSTLRRRLIVRDAGGAFHLIAVEGEDFQGAEVGLIEMKYAGMDGSRLAFNVLRTGDAAVWIADFGPPPSLEIPTAGTLGLGALSLLLAAGAVVTLRRSS